MLKSLRRLFAGAATLAAVSIVPAMASQMPLGDMQSHAARPNTTIRLPKHQLQETKDSGAYGIGGAATPNVRCPRGAYCLTP
ncbi:hypothetical protein Q3C01_24775 [Bradyrhizobium sp. UFLA05-109]